MSLYYWFILGLIVFLLAVLVKTAAWVGEALALCAQQDYTAKEVAYQAKVDAYHASVIQ